MKKCPPGVICIQQYMFIFLFFIIAVILYFMYIKQTNPSTRETHLVGKNNIEHTINLDVYDKTPGQQEDILLNPYTPPLKPNQYITQQHNGVKKMPINIKTQSCNREYKQIGILTRVNGEETVLPLMGRPLITHRDKWNYYTMNDKNNMIKLPLLFKNKSCTSEVGCDSVYDGDTLYVEGYKDLFRVTLYDNNTLEYIPYL